MSRPVAGQQGPAQDLRVQLEQENRLRNVQLRLEPRMQTSEAADGPPLADDFRSLTRMQGIAIERSERKVFPAPGQ